MSKLKTRMSIVPCGSGLKTQIHIKEEPEIDYGSSQQTSSSYFVVAAAGGGATGAFSDSFDWRNAAAPGIPPMPIDSTAVLGTSISTPAAAENLTTGLSTQRATTRPTEKNAKNINMAMIFALDPEAGFQSPIGLTRDSIVFIPFS
jgi:hypothetical protein